LDNSQKCANTFKPKLYLLFKNWSRYVSRFKKSGKKIFTSALEKRQKYPLNGPKNRKIGTFLPKNERNSHIIMLFIQLSLLNERRVLKNYIENVKITLR